MLQVVNVAMLSTLHQMLLVLPPFLVHLARLEQEYDSGHNQERRGKARLVLQNDKPSNGTREKLSTL